MLNRRKLLQLVESKGADSALVHLQEGLEQKVFGWKDFSIRDLAESLIVGQDGNPVGQEWIRSIGPQKSGGLTLLEASSAVDLSRFSNITGQIFYNRIMEAYQQPEYMASKLVSEYQTDLNGEKIPGLTGMTDDLDDDVHEGMEYPQIGFGEDYIETPVTTKKGRIVSVSKEAIFFDRTKQVMTAAGGIGEVLARRKEKMLWDVIWGITNNYKWRGTTYNTYQGTTPWINTLSGVDNGADSFNWKNLDSAEQLFTNMTDPNTGEAIIMNTNQIICAPQRKHVFRQVLGATRTETRIVSGTTTIIRDGGNTLDPYQLSFSPFGYQRLISAQGGGYSAAQALHRWIIGDLKRAFAWQYNWPITVVQAPSNSEAEFTQDIVLRWKASERGSAVVLEPRCVALIYNT